MRKLSVILLVLTLVFASFSVAFAEPTTTTDNITDLTSAQTVSKDVKIVYLGDTGGAKVYKVDVEWDDLTFTYTEAQSNTWNPEDHEMQGETNPTWSKETANIKVTNHSSEGVNVTATFAGENEASATVVDGTATSQKNGVTASIETNTQTLSNGVAKVDGEDNCPNCTFTVKIAGAPNSTFILDKINITVTAQ